MQALTRTEGSAGLLLYSNVSASAALWHMASITALPALGMQAAKLSAPILAMKASSEKQFLNRSAVFTRRRSPSP